MAFNLDDYEPVASRVQRFYEAYPDGAIHTEIVFDDGKRVVIRATVYRHVSDDRAAAVDFAEEHLTDRGVNATSRIENACTSAIGRAISVAAAGLGPSDWTKKPTREEMGKVQRMTTKPHDSHPNVKVTEPQGMPTEKQLNYARSLLKAGGFPEPANFKTMTRWVFSDLIDQLKNGTYAPAPDDTEEPF